jgi:hypothetical protein
VTRNLGLLECPILNYLRKLREIWGAVFKAPSKNYSKKCMKLVVESVKFQDEYFVTPTLVAV